MSSQQDIYAAGFETRPYMLNKENYVSWSRLLHYAKSRPNGKLIYNSIINGPYVIRTIPEPEPDDQAIKTILLGLPKEIYAAVDSCETAQEIWFTSTNGESIESYYHHFSKLMNDFKRNKHFLEKIASNLKFLDNLQPEWSRHVTIVHQTNDLHTSDYTWLYDFLKYNQKKVDELRAERLARTHDPLALMANSNNPFNYLVFHQDQPLPITFIQRISSKPRNRQIAQPGMHLGQDRQMQMVGGNGGNQFRKCAGQNNLNGNGNIVAARAEDNANKNNGNQIRCNNCRGLGHLDRNFTEQYTELLEPIPESHQVQQNDSNVISAVSSMEQGEGTVEQHSATVEETCAYHESLFHNLATEVEKVNSVNRKMKETNAELTTELARYKIKKSVLKLVMTNLKGMFRINPSKTSREYKFMPINKVKASVRTNPITVSQPHAITKNHVNSDSHGLSSTGVDNTAKTIRPQPRSNIKNDRVPSMPKSCCIKNKKVKVEEHHRNLPLSKNKKPMSSKSNNIKLSIRNDKSEVVCAMYKQFLITVNHDVCVLKYVNDMNSRGKKQKANASNVANQKKHKPIIRKPNKVGSKERLASPKPKKPRKFLRWSPTGRIFDLQGKIIASSESECQSDCSNGDNACTSNPQEPTSKRFPNFTFSLVGHSNLFMMRRLRMLKAHDRQSEASHKFHLEVLGNCLLGNDHVDAILGYGDLQWGKYSNHQAIATTCYTQNRSIIHCRFGKTPYELIHDKKPDISFLHVFRALCYPKNDHEDIGKLGAKGDIGFFIGYSANSCAYKNFNRRTKKIMETINVTFDELSAIAFEQSSSKPELQGITSGQISSGLDLTYAPSTITTQQPTENELDLLFKAMYDDYIDGQPSAATRTAPAA
nr:hypothetical protein [Tanacetum cinerariifolium]